MKWYTTLDRHLRRSGYKSNRSDLRVFSKREASSDQVIALIVVRVGDIISTGSTKEIAAFSLFLSGFHHGAIVFVEEDAPVTYCGLTLRRKGFALGICQDTSRDNVFFMQAGEFLGAQSNLATDARLRTASKTMTGGLIWLLQTTFDMSFWAVLMSTSIAPAIADRTLLPEFIKNCARDRKVMYSGNVAAWYHSFAPLAEQSKPQLVVYADAGYAALANSASVESFMVCYGVPIRRDGIVKMQEHAVSWQSRKMKRIDRSYLVSEALALSTSIEFVYWLRAVYV